LVVEVGLLVLAGFVSILAATLAIELISAVALERVPRHETGPKETPKIAVLIPAHNEGARLLATIEDVKEQLFPRGRVLVVADNCTDETAEVARAAGAEVTERQDAERRGKGYALHWGLEYLKADPPEIVIIVDADCRVGPNTIGTLASVAFTSGRPVQALYNMRKAEGGTTSHSAVQEFAWILVNHVRPIGLAKIGLPCQLMGTGMAFPWHAINSVPLATGDLVEDVKLGLDLAAEGYPPRFCPSVYVESTFPTSESGNIDQRRRWEIGSLRLLLRNGPRYLWRASRTGNLHLFFLAMDAMVPPLTLLGGLLVVFWLAALGVAVAGYGSSPLFVLTAAGVLVAGTLVAAWAKFGRHVLELKDAWQLVPFLIQKFKIYKWRPGHVLQWTRTDRS